MGRLTNSYGSTGIGGRWFLQSSVGAWVGLLWVNSALQYTKEAGGFKSAIRVAEGRGTKISGERGDNRLIPALPPVYCVMPSL